MYQAYADSAGYFENNELASEYYKKRLSQIRENWDSMFILLKLVVICVTALLQVSSNDEIKYMRTLLLGSILGLFELINYLIRKFDFAAKY